MKRILFAALVSLFAAGCGGTDDPDPRSIAGNKYDNPTIGLSLQFPSNWSLQLDATINGRHFDLSAKGPTVNGITPNVGVLVTSYTGDPQWKDILPQIHDALQAQFPNLGNYRDTLLESNGITYAEISYTGDPGGVSVKEIEDIILSKGRETVIAYADGQFLFDQNADIQAIHASMVLK